MDPVGKESGFMQSKSYIYCNNLFEVKFDHESQADNGGDVCRFESKNKYQ